MALTEQEKVTIKNLQQKGYSEDEVKEYIGAKRVGRPSITESELLKKAQFQKEQEKKAFEWDAFLGAPAKFLAPESVDVFSTALARRGIGTDEDIEAIREEYDEPTPRQYAGAVLQTLGLAADVGITVGTLGAGAPLTVGRNVALGAGFGYMYDVSEDLVAQESIIDALTPGYATALGAGAPLVAGAIGNVISKGASTVADDVARATVKPVADATAPVGKEVVETAVEKTRMPQEKVADVVAETTRPIANRVSRVARRGQEYLDDVNMKAEIRKNATPAVSRALDEGIDTKTILKIETATPEQKEAYKRVVAQASSETPKNAEVVAGEYATEMYRIAKKQERQVGAELGKAREALGDVAVPFDDNQKMLRDVFSQNGIYLKNNGKVEFAAGNKLIDEEQKVIENIWKRLYSLDEITPKQVNDIDQYLSKLEYRTNVVDKISSVRIDVPEINTGKKMEQPVFQFIRNTVNSKLDELDTTGKITALKRQYAQAKSVTNPIENTWYRGIDLSKATDDELASASSLGLRRLDSRVTSRVTYGQIYRALDKYSRDYGYKGADASDVSSFYLSHVEPLYPESTPKASFGGGILGGVRSAIETIADIGKVAPEDKQKALKALLEIE